MLDRNFREVIRRLSKIFAGKIFRHTKSADNQCPKSRVDYISEFVTQATEKCPLPYKRLIDEIKQN